MVEHWLFYDLDTEPLVILDGYGWSGEGLNIVLRTFSASGIMSRRTIKYSILFNPEVEGFQVRFLPNSLAAEDWAYELMCQASEEAPCVPLFITDSSKLIEKVKETAGYDGEGKKYKHYTVYATDMWLDIVSSNPPTISKIE